MNTATSQATTFGPRFPAPEASPITDPIQADIDEAWNAANLPLRQKKRWRELYEEFFNDVGNPADHPAGAERLHKYWFAPQMIRRLLRGYSRDEGGNVVGAFALTPPHSTTNTDQVEAFTALAREITIFSLNPALLVPAVRYEGQAIMYLAHEHNWTPAMIATLCGTSPGLAAFTLYCREEEPMTFGHIYYGPLTETANDTIASVEASWKSEHELGDANEDAALRTMKRSFRARRRARRSYEGRVMSGERKVPAVEPTEREVAVTARALFIEETGAVDAESVWDENEASADRGDMGERLRNTYRSRARIALRVARQTLTTTD